MSAQHQGLPVPGYKPQSSEAAAKISAMKEMEECVLRALDALAVETGTDKRGLAVGRTHIEQGFMAVNRSIFAPGRVALPEDPQE